MAHFAKVENNIVIQIVAVSNSVLQFDGHEVEQLGIDFLNILLGPAQWVQTSYHGSMRNKFAAIGDTWDEVRNVFISKRPFPSWTLDENILDWRAPYSQPAKGLFAWDEENIRWKQIR